MKYPPFCDIITFGISSSNKNEVQIASKKLYSILQKNIRNSNVKMEIYNPVVSPISKIKNKYRWRIVGKCILSNNIIDLVNNTLDEYYKLKFKNTRVIADINPNNMN